MVESSHRLSTAVISETEQKVVRPALFAAFDFFNGMTRVWSGFNTIKWRSYDWLPLADMGAVSSIEETMAVKSTGATFQLSGVPANLISTVMNVELQNRNCWLWIAFMNEQWKMIGDASLIFSGFMDTISIQDGGETALITMNAENRLRDLDRPRERRWTTEDQVVTYPGDLGFTYVPMLQSAIIDWGTLV